LRAQARRIRRIISTRTSNSFALAMTASARAFRAANSWE
jgi:hypothetical protein